MNLKRNLHNESNFWCDLYNNNLALCVIVSLYNHYHIMTPEIRGYSITDASEMRLLLCIIVFEINSLRAINLKEYLGFSN